MGLWEQKVENKGESDQQVAGAEVILSLTQLYSLSYKKSYTNLKVTDALYIVFLP